MGVFGSLSLKELSMLKGLLGDSKAYCVMCQGSTVGKAGSVGCSCELDGFLWDGRRVWRFNRSGIRHGATGSLCPSCCSGFSTPGHTRKGQYWCEYPSQTMGGGSKAASSGTHQRRNSPSRLSMWRTSLNSPLQKRAR